MKQITLQLEPHRVGTTNTYVASMPEDFKAEIRDGMLFFIEECPPPPSTYEECCAILGITYPYFADADVERPYSASTYRLNLMANYIKLLICRDAYWTLANDWRPDWNNEDETKFYIAQERGHLSPGMCKVTGFPFVFPTAEMRDAFLTNFQPLLHKCIELL